MWKPWDTRNLTKEFLKLKFTCLGITNDGTKKISINPDDVNEKFKLIRLKIKVKGKDVLGKW